MNWRERIRPDKGRFEKFRRMDKPRFPTGITSFFLGSAPDRARFEPGKPRFRAEKRGLSRLNAYLYGFP